MDIRIGIKNAGRELNFESNASAEEIQKIVKQAIDSGEKLISLQDSKGNHYLVPTESLGYIEIGAEETRRVGFIA